EANPFRTALSMAPRLIVPAVPPLPTIWKRSFHAVGSLIANPASGQITPRTSQCAGILPLASTRVADCIFTSLPNEFPARPAHLMAGSPAKTATAEDRNNQSAFTM